MEKKKLDGRVMLMFATPISRNPYTRHGDDSAACHEIDEFLPFLKCWPRLKMPNTFPGDTHNRNLSLSCNFYLYPTAAREGSPPPPHPNTENVIIK
jgi:hypothetical protein